MHLGSHHKYDLSSPLQGKKQVSGVNAFSINYSGRLELLAFCTQGYSILVILAVLRNSYCQDCMRYLSAFVPSTNYLPSTTVVKYIVMMSNAGSLVPSKP